MNLVFLFLASTLSTAAAAPMQPAQGSSSTPNPNYVPKVEFGHRSATSNDKAATKDMIIDHYKGLEPGNEQKEARLAFVKNPWRDGGGPLNEHRQYLNFDYHRGPYSNTDKIGQAITIARDRPPPESHFASTVSPENKAEIAGEMNKKYNNKVIPPDQAKHVRSMKAQGDWSDGPGFREQTQMTFHRGTIPTQYNKLGDPITIYRPMSFLMDRKVPKEQIPDIKQRIRQEHEKLDETHPLKQANYGVVNDGWHRESGYEGLHVKTTLYKVKDEISGKAEEDYERVGDFHVPFKLDQKRKPEVAGSSTSSREKRASYRDLTEYY